MALHAQDLMEFCHTLQTRGVGGVAGHGVGI